MSTRNRAMIAAPLVAGFLVGCASTPTPLPAPHGADAAALTIRVDLRLPLQAWLDSADAVATTVYFVKDCPPSDPPCDEKLIPSNHENHGRVYLLNAEPGEYRPVAAAYQSAVYYVVGSAHVVNVVYFPDDLVSNAGVQVQAGRMSDAGHYRVHAVHEVCATTADPGQLRYAELMEPGVRKCGLLGILTDSLRHPLRGLTSPLVIGNKAYPAGTGANHFRGVSHETLRGAPDAQALGEARRELEGAGWSFEGRP
jgi:hypothetical protein